MKGNKTLTVDQLEGLNEMRNTTEAVLCYILPHHVCIFICTYINTYTHTHVDIINL